MIRDAVCEQRDGPSIGVHWADSPWSVPRLLGRGEQGIMVMQSPISSGLYRRSLSFHTLKSAVKRSASLTVSLAYHGLASEARSTACALC